MHDDIESSIQFSTNLFFLLLLYYVLCLLAKMLQLASIIEIIKLGSSLCIQVKSSRSMC